MTWEQEIDKLILEINNVGQNICILFNVLVQFFFTTSETELNYYHQTLPQELPNDLKLLENKDS